MVLPNHVVFDEVSGNSFLALRKLRWNPKSPFRLDIRKWYTNAEGEEIAGKGVSFLTPEGPENLVQALIENGYCDTRKTLNGLKNREDFPIAIKEIITECGIDLDKVDISIDQLDSTATFYDPKAIL